MMAGFAMKKPGDKKVLVSNRKARHDYFVDDTLEAGLVLVGSEVKSLRESKASMTDAYATVKNGEAWLMNLQIDEYKWANRFNHEPKRERKLLLNKSEIKKLDEAIARGGYTAIPLELYLKEGRIKALLGICRGKKQYDKRADQKRRTADREIEQALRRR
jgi:SsrA-binding protein